mgnify:CR=1 FL=1
MTTTRLFRLIGYTGPIFRTVREFENAAGILAIHGKTLDGRLQTTARVVDVVFLNEEDGE